jgi:hypothetical protein
MSAESIPDAAGVTYRPLRLADDAREMAEAMDFLVVIAGQAYFAMPDGIEKAKLGIALSPFHDMVRHFHNASAE